MGTVRKQRGISLIALAFLLVGLTIIGMLGVKLAPMFIDNTTINEVIKSVANDPATQNMSIGQIRDSIEKRLLVNGLDKYAKLAKFRKEGGILYLSLDYERREKLWANVDLVGVFQNRAEIRTNR